MPAQLLRNNIVPFRGLVLLLCVFAVQNCWACRVAPKEQLIGVDEQIMAATDVSVAEVISATPVEGRVVEYRFRVLQRLTGYDRRDFTMTGSAPVKGAMDNSFDNHTDPAFWKGGGGRLMNESDCRIYPSFVVGGRYLMFLGSPFTRRSAEKIEAVDWLVTSSDTWLAYVKAGLDRRTYPETSGPRVRRNTDDGSQPAVAGAASLSGNAL